MIEQAANTLKKFFPALGEVVEVELGTDKRAMGNLLKQSWQFVSYYKFSK
jgi:hypothetical protein